MVIDRDNILPQWPLLIIEEVDEFIYLETLISNQGECDKEIRECIVMSQRFCQITWNTISRLVKTVYFQS